MQSFEKKFRISELRVARFDGWSVSVRPSQVTLGSLVVSSEIGTASFRGLPQDTLDSLGKVFSKIEKVLERSFEPELIHFMAIMLVDRRIHFHVFPRYRHSVTFFSEVWRDPDFPGPLARLDGKTLEPVQERRLVETLALLFHELS